MGTPALLHLTTTPLSFSLDVPMSLSTFSSDGKAWIVGEAAPSRLLEGQPAPLPPGGPYLGWVSHMSEAAPMCWLIGSATAGAAVAGGHGYLERTHAGTGEQRGTLRGCDCVQVCPGSRLEHLHGARAPRGIA